MKNKIVFAVTIIHSLLTQHVFSQIEIETQQSTITAEPFGSNKRAWVGERVGLTDVSIQYNRPGVKGREGKIWGGIIHKGFGDLTHSYPGNSYGNSTKAPWRAGANENTTIEFTNDVKIEGKDLPAGKYGFFIAYDSIECTVILSKNYSSWGSFFYNEEEDALRVKVKPVKLDQSIEWLEYKFSDQTTNSATISLAWEKLKIPFKIEVDFNKQQIEAFRRELRSDKGFDWASYFTAAQWCLSNNINLDEALLWADTACSPGYFGDKLYVSLDLKAQLLEKIGRIAESDRVMKDAITYGSMLQIHSYARRLLLAKRVKEALEIFKLNLQKNPNQFVTLMGALRGYSANADYKIALKYAKLALPLSPNPANKKVVEEMIKKLQGGTDVN